MNKLSLVAGKKVNDYVVLYTFDINDEKYIVYTDKKKDNDGYYPAYLGKMEDGVIECNINPEIIEVAERLLDKIEKDD